jgi:hypothetical protein
VIIRLFCGLERHSCRTSVRQAVVEAREKDQWADRESHGSRPGPPSAERLAPTSADCLHHLSQAPRPRGVGEHTKLTVELLAAFKRSLAAS